MQIERRILLPVPHYCTYLAPERKRGARLPLLVALHGYAGDADSMLRLAGRICREDLLLAAVPGLHQFWVPSVEAIGARRVGFGWFTSWKTGESQARHHRWITHIIADACRNMGAHPGKVFLLGFSQACALNYRYAFTHPGILRGVIGVCGGIPGDFRDPKYRAIPAGVLHVAAKRDEYYSTAKSRSFAPELRRLAADVTYREYDSVHAFPRRSLSYIRRWILERC